MSRADDVDAELESLYAQVPEIGCKGLCTDSCGPIDAGLRELTRIARAGVRLPPHEDAVREMGSKIEDYECPALIDGACSVYDVRPMICRVWGASEMLVCPYGCRPEPGTKRLSHAQAMALLDAARTAGTIEQPVPLAEWERRFADPDAHRRFREFVPQTEAVKPIPPKTRRRR